MNVTTGGIRIEGYSNRIADIANRLIKNTQSCGELGYDEYAPAYDFFIWQRENADKTKTYDYIFNNDDLLGVMMYEKLYGIDICFPVVFDNRQNEKVENVIANYLMNKGIYIIEKNRESNLFAEYELINGKSKNGKDEYQFGYHSAMSPLSKERMNDIRDAFEREYFIDDINGYEIEKMDEKQAKAGLETISCDNCNHIQYPGMFYFCPNDYFYGNDYYLVAHKDNHILGVLKMYNRGSEQALSYVDVGERYQNHGIAKAMIKELDKYLDKTRPLQLSSQSDIGRQCHMAELFERNIHSTNVVRSSIDVDLDRLIASKTTHNEDKTTHKDVER